MPLNLVFRPPTKLCSHLKVTERKIARGDCALTISFEIRKVLSLTFDLLSLLKR